jgi:nitrite reductase/ring-hydroxylating ferredoxin subunit
MKTCADVRTMHAFRSPLTRRELLQASALFVGASCLCRQLQAAPAPRASCCFTPEVEPQSVSIGDEIITIDLAKASSLAEIPSAAYIVAADSQIQIIVVRRAKSDYVAVSRLCTHASQVISYVRKRGLLQCNGFNHSLFDLHGRVVKGPAESPLKVYPVELAGTILKIAYREA